MSVAPIAPDEISAPWRERRTAGDAALRHGLSPATLARLDTVEGAPRRIAKGRALYRAGSAANAIYVVRSGAFKTVSYLPTGRSQITGVHIRGDILGLPGVADGAHPEDAIAVAPARVAPLPTSELARLAQQDRAMQRNLSRVLGAAVVRAKRALLLFGHRNAEERLAFVLVDFLRRLRGIAEPAGEFDLPLTNNDLANLAGMTGETVSRLLKGLEARELIVRDGRHVRVVDAASLEQLAGAGR